MPRSRREGLEHTLSTQVREGFERAATKLVVVAVVAVFNSVIVRERYGVKLGYRWLWNTAVVHLDYRGRGQGTVRAHQD